MTQTARPTIYQRNQPTPADHLLSASDSVHVPSLYEIPTNPLLTSRQNMCASLEARGLRGTRLAHAAGMTFSEVRAARQLPAYNQTIAQILAHADIEAVSGTVAYRAGRIQSVSERYRALQQIIEQRAQACDPAYLNPDPEFIRNELRLDPQALHAQFPTLGMYYEPSNPACHMCDPDAFLVPGTDTGMYTKTYKVIGAGLAARNIVEWKFDDAIAAEMRHLEERAAIETGQNRQVDSIAKMYINVDVGRI